MNWGRFWPSSRLRAAAGALAAAGFSCGSAFAAEPSTKIGVAPLLSPAAADAYYSAGGSTSSNRTGETGRPKEIVELARALKGDPDLIYEHVRNNAEMVWTYGLTKGAMGVVVDRAGNAFDQAHLMVELLRQSGRSASFKIGTITLTGAQFAEWSGITSATAACQLLSSGGIPALINGSTQADCAYGAVTVSTIELGHVWVATTISGVEYLYDPAFKGHVFKEGLNLGAAMSMAAGDALTISSTSATTAGGVPYGQSFNTGGLKTKLDGYAAALETHLAANAPNASVADVVGGVEAITPQALPTSGLRQVSLPYLANAQRTVTGNLPDIYRTSLRVRLTKARPGDATEQVIDKTLAVDEVYGRRLVFDPSFDTAGAAFTGALKVVDEFGAATTLASTGTFADDPTFSRGTISLDIGLPYAAQSGGYMDAAVVRPVSYALPFTIVHGWGETGRGLIDKWGSRKDSDMPAYTAAHDPLNYSRYKSTKGDGRRELIAASWLAQASRAGQLHAAIAKSVFTQHYSVGISAADTAVQTNQPGFYWVTDSYDRLDVETGFSFTSKSGNAADRRAGLLASAATIAALKGSVSAQVSDLPDAGSVATRFEWGNAPEANMDPGGNGYTRPVYQYDTSAAAEQALALSTVERQTTTTNDGIHSDGNLPEIGAAETLARRQQLADAVSAYVSSGFKVTASGEAFLGPGKRAGAFVKSGSSYTHLLTPQRGGALSAIRYDANGDPLEVAHVLVNPTGLVDGGGGGAQTYHHFLYDPAINADVVKGRYINPQPGSVTIVSPAKLRVGAGSFPYALTGELVWRNVSVGNDTSGAPDHRGPQGGWSTNWNNNLTISGSALEAMGDSGDVRAATGAIAAFAAAQDIYRTTPTLKREVVAQLINAWWARNVADNIATVSVGANVRQFIRKPNGQWLAHGPGAYATLTQTGQRTLDPHHCYSSSRYRASRGWGYEGIAFTLTGSDGAIQTFNSWEHPYQSGETCREQRGMRLVSWTWPTGVQLSFNYTSSQYYTELPSQLDYVTNNLNQRLNLINGGLGGIKNSQSGTWLRQILVGGTAAQPTHTDPAGAVTKYDVVSFGSGEYAASRIARIYEADDANNPAKEYVYDALGRLSQLKDKLVLAGAKAPDRFLLADGLRGETIDALGYASTVYADGQGRPIRMIDALRGSSSTSYDGRGRVRSTVGPESNRVDYEYNARNQQTKQTVWARPDSAEAGQSIVTETGWNATWNQPEWTKDAKGAQTDFTYSYGQLTKITHPAAVTGAARETETKSYYSSGLAMSYTTVLGRNLGMTYNNVSIANLTDTVGAVSGTYAATNDTLGDATVLQRPRGGRINITYDALRRPILEVGPLVGTEPRSAKRISYDVLGRVTQVEIGTYVDTTFTPREVYKAEYDVLGRKTKDVTPTSVTQYSYDALGRIICTAERMNPAIYGALPADACTPSAIGQHGPDRISRNTYDPLGRVILQEIGVGTDSQQVAQRQTYSPDGQVTSLTDANGNRSVFEYDGFARLSKLRYPSATRGSGQSSSADYEAYTYDVNGNRTSVRKRDGRFVNFTYDARNRLILKDIPDGSEADVYYDYKSNGREIFGRFGSAANAVFYRLTTDQAGRLVGDYSAGLNVTSTYDSEGSRTKVDAAGRIIADYAYDISGRLMTVTWSAKSGATVIGSGQALAASYGALDRIAAITRQNGINSTYSYDNAGRLIGLSHTGSVDGLNFDQTLSYNPLGQLVEQSQVAQPFVWTEQPATTANYTHDGLNRDAAVVAADGYDALGNLTGDGARTFTYDIENRLVAVSGGSAPVALSYDPFGRLEKLVVNGGATTRFVYNGQALVQEYNGTGTAAPNLLRSYVHGNGADDVIFWLEGAITTTTVPSAQWYHKDRLGTIVGISSASGVIIPYAYGPYGEPQDWSGSRFRYTGQTAIAEAQLYYYKARVYDPSRGHFLQTDPIGYADGLNLYAYVGDDPLNRVDPSGMIGVGGVFGLGWDLGALLIGSSGQGQFGGGLFLADGGGASFGSFGGAGAYLGGPGWGWSTTGSLGNGTVGLGAGVSSQGYVTNADSVQQMAGVSNGVNISVGFGTASFQWDANGIWMVSGGLTAGRGAPIAVSYYQTTSTPSFEVQLSGGVAMGTSCYAGGACDTSQAVSPVLDVVAPTYAYQTVTGSRIPVRVQVTGGGGGGSGSSSGSTALGGHQKKLKSKHQ